MLMAMACWEVGSALLLWIEFETCQVRRRVVLVHSREVSITINAAYEGTAYGEAVLRMERVTEGAAEGAVGPGAH